MGGTAQIKAKNQMMKLRLLTLSSTVGLFPGSFLLLLITFQENLFVSGVESKVIAVLTIILPPAFLSVTGLGYIALTVRNYFLSNETLKSTSSGKNMQDQDQ